MHVLAALALLISPPPSGSPGIVVGEPNLVHVCSVAAGECRQLSAAALDPTVGASGAAQVAFIDEATGALTLPTREQLEELDGPLTVYEETRIGAVVDTVHLVNGGVVAAPRGGFMVELRVELPADEAAPPAAAATAPAADASAEGTAVTEERP